MVKLAYECTDTEIRIMGIQVLFRELGCVNALRFIAQMQRGLRSKPVLMAQRII